MTDIDHNSFSFGNMPVTRQKQAINNSGAICRIVEKPDKRVASLRLSINNLTEKNI